MIVNILITIVMGWIASSASICLKLATSGEKLSIAGLLRNKWLYFGGMLYVIAALLNIYLLKKLPYSVVVPLGALTYVSQFQDMFLTEYISETFARYGYLLTPDFEKIAYLPNLCDMTDTGFVFDDGSGSLRYTDYVPLSKLVQTADSFLASSAE